MSCSKCGHNFGDSSDHSSDEPLPPVYPNRPCLFPGCKLVDDGKTYSGTCWPHSSMVDYNTIRETLNKWYTEYYADLERREPGKLKKFLEEGVRRMAYSYYSCDGFPYEYTYPDLYISMDDDIIDLPGGKKYRIVLEEVQDGEVKDEVKGRSK